MSVWLYGARGERTGPESDVDVMVLTRGDSERAYDQARRAMDHAADAAGASEFFFSVQVRDLDWLADRRAGCAERAGSVRAQHKGMWDVFRRTFVEGGEFDSLLAHAAVATQEPREDADYRARRLSDQQVRETLALAERFVAAVRELIEG